MELTNDELKDFRERALQASIYGHQIGLAELYVETLAAEVGHSDVASDVTPASATHLLALANEALELRAHGKKPKRHKKAEDVKPASVPPPKAEEPKPEEPKAEEPKVELPVEPGEPQGELPAEEADVADEGEEEHEEEPAEPASSTGSVAPKAPGKKTKKKK